MREPSIYMSDWFVNTLWPDFRTTLRKTKTQVDYFTVACQICDYLKKDFLDIAPSDAQYYFDHLAEKTEGRHTIRTLHSKLTSLRSIGFYIVENKERYGLDASYQSAFNSVSLPDYATYLSADDILTPAEMDQMLALGKKHGEQMFLILILMLRCSLTISEVCGLGKGQVGLDAAGRCFLSLRKQSASRYILVPDDVVPYLTSAVERAHHPSGRLFLNEWNRPITARNLQKYYADMVSDTSLGGRFSLKDLRNASIAYMLAGGAKREDVAAYADVQAQWMYRYDKVLPELDAAPCQLSRIRIL